MNAKRLLEVYDQISEAPDAIARLRRFVLDLAVRGKLVEQVEKGETSLELLERIRAEKARLVKAGAIRKSRTEAQASEAEPFELPSSWTWVPFGEIHHLVRGVTYSKADVSEVSSSGFTPVLRANNIASILTHDDPVYVKSTRVSPDKYLRKGDYMIALSSGSKNLVGKAAVVPTDLNEAFGGFCGAVRLFEKSLVGFVGVFLSSNLYRDSISAGSRGIGINNLKKEVLANLHFPLPPLAEQHRIVAKVDELMALCDRLEEAHKSREELRDKLTAASLARLTAPDTTPEDFPTHAAFALEAFPALTTRPDQIKTLRQTILNLAVRGKLTFDHKTHSGEANASESAANHAKPYVIHSSWSWAVMEELVHFQGGSQPPKSTFIYEPREGYTRLVQIRDFKSNANLTFVPNHKANRPFDETDVMIGRYGPPVFQILRGLSGTYNVALMKASPKTPKLSNDFLFLLLQESRIHDEVVAESQRTAGQTGVRLPLLRSFVVGLPPLTEQHRIVAKVDALMALCDRLEAALTTTDTTRTRLLESLLHEALEPAANALEAAE